MLKKLCVWCVAIGLGVGVIGCGDKKASTPTDTVPPPTETPSDQTMSITPPE